MTAVIRNYLSQSVMGAGRFGGGAGLMLATSGWTDRPDRRAVFVSERKSVGLWRHLRPNPALLFSQGLRGSCESSGLSTVHCLLCRYSQARRTSLIFLFLPEGSTLSHPSFCCFLMEVGNSSILALSLCLPCSLSALFGFFLCNKL